MCNCTDCMCGEVGFRLKPSDEELIHHYLRGKMIGHDHRAIPEIDLCKFEPWELPDLSPVKSGDNFWYFISPVEHKYNNSERANRTTKAGYWKVTGKDRQVRDSDSGEIIGTKKILGFYKGRVRKGVRTPWIIHQYQLHPADTSNKKAYVVFRLERKPVVKNSTSQKVEPGSSSASTSHSKAAEAEAEDETETEAEAEVEAEADNALTEGTPNLHASQEPFPVCNYMENDVAPQASMQEQGASLQDHLELIDLSEDQNGMQESMILTQGTPHLHASQEPFTVCNSMENDVAPQASMQEQGASLEDQLKLDDLSKDQNGMQEKGYFGTDKWLDGLFFKDTEGGYQFVAINQEEFGKIDKDPYFPEETFSTHLHDYRPPMSLTEAGIYNTRETVTEIVDIQNQYFILDGSWNNQMGSSFDDSTAATSYELNSRELIQEDSSINTRYLESRYQPRSPKSLAEEAPLQLPCGILGNETPFGDKVSDVELPKSSFSCKRKRERGETSDEN